MEIKDLEQFNITNTIIFDSFCKMISVYNKHNKIVCSISGGGGIVTSYVTFVAK